MDHLQLLTSMEQFQFSYYFCFLIPIILLTSVTSVLFYSRAYKTATSKRIPGPWRLPIIGSLHHFLSRPLLPHRRLRDLALRHGPHLMLLGIGQIDYVVVSSRDAAEEVLKTYDRNFSNRPHVAAVDKLSYGYTNIVFSPYGNYWRQLRKICTTELLTAKRVKSFAPIRKEEISNLVDKISASVGTPVNLSRMLMSLSNGIVFRAVMGKRCAHEDKFIELMKKGFDLVTGTRTVADFFPSMGFLDVVSGTRTKLERMQRSYDEILDEIVDEHERSVLVTSNKDKEEEDILDLMLKIKDSGNLDIPLTRQNIKAVVTDLFGAGTDTSYTTIEWVMVEMMRNTKVMKKAQTEIRQAAWTNLEEIDLTYLKLVIKETLRLHPPAPFFARECRDDCEVQGYSIRKGQRIIVNVWALARDPNCWEDPDCFKPERFEKSPIDFKGANFSFLPFGVGRRMCPGITFAMATVEAALVHLLFYFDWQLPHGMKTDELDMTENFSGTVSRKEDLLLVAKAVM